MLVEKPMATSVQEATELMEAATVAPGEMVCAPHVPATIALPMALPGVTPAQAVQTSARRQG
ncbi:hypothetical protein ACWEQP_25030 [Streptomyces sp. NPDC004044]